MDNLQIVLESIKPDKDTARDFVSQVISGKKEENMKSIPLLKAWTELFRVTVNVLATLTILHKKKASATSNIVYT